MAHLANPDRSYRLLQQRLDRNVTGAPDSPAFTQILKLLFSPEDAEIARQMPTTFVSVNRLARKLETEPAALDARLTRMAERGLVLDIERRGKRYFTLSPVVIGFFEYTFMRQGSDLPLGELARLFDEYFFQNDRFVRSVFTGETQIGRSLAREEALVSGDHVEILDWERASHLIETASAHAVSTCACRHHHSHLGTACERPQRTCLTLNHGAELLARNGIAERIDVHEAMQILEISKKAGLAQTGDNVQHKVSYICNCCPCCCGMMTAIRRFDIKNAIVSSNWISEIDLERCSGCGLCVAACPTAAIEIVVGEAEEGRKKPPRWAVREADLCLGCGVCYGLCHRGAMHLRPREQRVFTPETTFDRMVAMAIERGKLADLILDNTEGWGYHALGRIIQVIEATPPYKSARAIKPLRSAFLNAVVSGVKASAGQAKEVVG
jgi:formate hydrogenlyase subunit 6/NADH:ubiquinone oxidoreductase subunit I